MKTPIRTLTARLKNTKVGQALSFRPALVTGLVLLSASQGRAQTFTTLHSFTGYDGVGPRDPLTLAGNTLYGTTSTEFSGNIAGTLFSVKTDGSDFTVLADFGLPTLATGEPRGGLIFSAGNLYGTTQAGPSGPGAVFEVSTNGADFTILYGFTPLSNGTNSDGAHPQGGLVLSRSTFYGTTPQGGNFGAGTIFAVNDNGSNFTTLHSFTALTNGTNSDGAGPVASLALSGDTLFGTTLTGGAWGNGAVFSINTNGSDFTNLHSFTALSNGANADGASPWNGLTLSGNTLYGTAYQGGASSNGTVFALNRDGSGFTTLHSFSPYVRTFSNDGTNSDGASPWGGLALSGNTLYGTAYLGGASGGGTVFSLNTNGTGFATLYNFTAIVDGSNSDGDDPLGTLILSGNTLYGTGSGGGISTLGFGTAFSLSLAAPGAPQLTIIPSGTNVVLTWPANVTGFTLESSTNLSFLAVWNPVSPTPTLTNAQNTLTIPLSGAQQFFQLAPSPAK